MSWQRGTPYFIKILFMASNFAVDEKLFLKNWIIPNPRKIQVDFHSDFSFRKSRFPLTSCLRDWKLIADRYPQTNIEIMHIKSSFPTFLRICNIRRDSFCILIQIHEKSKNFGSSKKNSRPHRPPSSSPFCPPSTPVHRSRSRRARWDQLRGWVGAYLAKKKPGQDCNYYRWEIYPQIGWQVFFGPGFLSFGIKTDPIKKEIPFPSCC